MKKSDEKIALFIEKVLNKDMDIKKKILFIKIIKFIIVGGIATIIDWVIYYLLYNFLNFNPLVANIVSFSISLIYNFILSIRWVFDIDESKNKKTIFIKFVIYSVIGLLISELLLYIFIEQAHINMMLSKIISTAIVMIFNFVTRQHFLEKN